MYVTKHLSRVAAPLCIRLNIPNIRHNLPHISLTIRLSKSIENTEELKISLNTVRNCITFKQTLNK